MGERLILVGKVDPVDRKYYEEIIRPLIDGDQIVFMGEVSEDKKRELLKSAKCFVFPIQWPEPFGLVMAEALACGTPVVAIRNGSSPEVIRDSRVGFIVDSVEEIPDAIHRTSQIDPNICRKYVVDNFSPEIMAENYIKNYKRILGDR
jgi:glycosyltransferase involved in cell wall biosynthesis